MAFPTRRAPDPPAWWHRYVQIRHVDRGRDFDGCDCWGLLMLVLEEQTGVKVSQPMLTYGSTRYRDPSVAAFAGAAIEQWEEAPIAPFAALLFEVGGQPAHVGIAIDERRFLHTQARLGVQIGDLDDRMFNVRTWRDRLMGAYRYAP